MSSAYGYSSGYTAPKTNYNSQYVYSSGYVAPKVTAPKTTNYNSQYVYSSGYVAPKVTAPKTTNYNSQYVYSSGYVAPKTTNYNSPYGYSSGYTAPKATNYNSQYVYSSGYTAPKVTTLPAYSYSAPRPYVAPYVAPRAPVAVAAQAQRPGGTSANSAFNVTASSWDASSFGRTGGAMGMSIDLALALGNVLKATRSALDEVIVIARSAALLSQMTTTTSHIAQIADRAWSAGNQTIDRARLLDGHTIAPRVNNLGTGTLTTPNTGSIAANLTGSDRALLRYATQAGSTDRVQGGTGQLPTGQHTNTASTNTDRRFFELNTPVNYGLTPTAPQRTGWEGYAGLPGGEFDGIANPGPNPNPTVDLNAAIAGVAAQFATPMGPLREVDILASEVGEIRELWAESDRVEASANNNWAYGREGIAEEAGQLRQQAWERVEALGEDPGRVLGAIVNSDATDRDIATAVQVDKSQRLAETADSLSAGGFAFEVAEMRRESDALLSELFLTGESRAVLDQLGSTFSPYEKVAIVNYAGIAADGGQAVIDSGDPVRVLEIIGQRYTEEVALGHVANSPSSGLGSKTFIELETALATMEANNDTNRIEFDATLRELDARSQDISGEIYVRTDLEAIRISDRAGLGYGDSLAIVIDARLDNVGGHPGARDAQMAAIQEDLETLVEVRHQEAVDERNAIYEFAVNPVAPIGDPAEQARRLLGILGAGASVNQAEAFNNAIPDSASTVEAIQLTRQINNLIDGGQDISTAAGLAIAAFDNDIELADVLGTAADEGIDLASAFNLHYAADRRDMTISELQAYQGITDREIFEVIDNAQGGDRDGRVSIEDLNYVINDPNADAEVVAAAQAFLNSPDLMARLDTARDFSDNVVDHESFGRDRVDDQLWSLDDIDSFELKQSVNFALSGLVDTIDTAGEGGQTDEHLSKQDFQAVLDDADALGLSDTEIAAITTVINGKLYDQHWIERNRDSLAIAAAVVAGTVIFVATGGVGAGLSVALVGSVVAGTAGAAGTAAVVTGGINAFTQEDLTDGVAGNAFKGGVVGGLAAPGLALGGAGWAGAGVGSRLLIGVGLAGEGAGLVGVGAVDFAIDPFYDGDSIDMDNLRGDADRASLLLAGGSLLASGTSLAGRKVLASIADEPLDVAPIVLQLDGITPPAGVTYAGDGFRLNSPDYVDGAFNPGNYLGASHRYSGAQVPGLYMGTDTATTLAEAGGDASGMVPLSRSVDIDNVLDLTDPAIRDHLGVSLEAITGLRQYEITQPIGEWALANGYDGILAPSAQLSGGTNLVVFTNDIGGGLADAATRNADDVANLANDARTAFDDAATAAEHASGLADDAIQIGDNVLDDAVANLDDAIAQADGLFDEAVELADGGQHAIAEQRLGDAIGMVDDASQTGIDRVDDAVDGIVDASGQADELAETAAAAEQASAEAAEAAQGAQAGVDSGSATTDLESAERRIRTNRRNLTAGQDDRIEAVSIAEDTANLVIETVADAGSATKGAILPDASGGE